MPPLPFATAARPVTRSGPAIWGAVDVGGAVVGKAGIVVVGVVGGGGGVHVAGCDLVVAGTLLVWTDVTVGT